MGDHIGERMKKQIKKLLYSFFGMVGKAPAGTIPVLTYHSIDRSGSPISKDPEAFRAELSHLKELGYHFLTAREYLEVLTNARTTNERKRVLVTFDDGYQNNLTEAKPIIDEFGATASIFLATGFLGGYNDWLNSPGVPRLAMLTEEEVQELSAGGIDILPHTHGHLDLTDATPEEIESDLDENEAVLKALVGESPRLFCYPFGRSNEAVHEVLRERGIKAAFSTRFGLNVPGPGLDLFDLKRLGSAKFSGVAELDAALDGSLEKALAVKKAVLFKR